MKTISLSEAKASLSQQVRHVREGEEVVITHRGRPVAKIVPVEDRPSMAGIDRLVADGLVRRGTGTLPPHFWNLDRPEDPDASVRAAISEERESGW
jgi:prevent-host-death family protein